jgi:hypothetical protein
MHNVVRAQIQIAVLVGENVSAWQRLTSDHIPFTVYTLAAKQVNIAKAFYGTRTPKTQKNCHLWRCRSSRCSFLRMAYSVSPHYRQSSITTRMTYARVHCCTLGFLVADRDGLASYLECHIIQEATTSGAHRECVCVLQTQQIRTDARLTG